MPKFEGEENYYVYMRTTKKDKRPWKTYVKTLMSVLNDAGYRMVKQDSAMWEPEDTYPDGTVGGAFYFRRSKKDTIRPHTAFIKKLQFTL